MLRPSTYLKLIKNPQKILLLSDYLFFDIRFRKTALKQVLLAKDEAVAALARLSVRNSPPLLNQSMYETFSAEKSEPAFIKIKDLFNSYGSNKASEEEYHYLYSHILRTRVNESLKILEIGLGSNNVDVPSNMGRFGSPGASLRALRDFGPHFHIYGADVDKRILFEENRIKTFYVDQTSPATFDSLAMNFEKHSLDLIIDDGLHTPQANLNFFNFAVDFIKPGGSIIVEDITPTEFPYWQIVNQLISNEFDCMFFTVKRNCLFLAKKN